MSPSTTIIVAPIFVISILTVGASATAFISIVVVYSSLNFPFPSPTWNLNCPSASLFAVGSKTTFPAPTWPKVTIWSFVISTLESWVATALVPSGLNIVSPTVIFKNNFPFVGNSAILNSLVFEETSPKSVTLRV